MTQEFRIDTNIKFDSYEKTKDGFLKADAFLTRCGVFQYEDQDGNIYNELRHPDDVFDPVSIETLKNLPLTNEHPSEFLTTENCKKYQVGFSGDMLRMEEGLVGATTTWTDGPTIAQIESAEKRDMSSGYYCDVIDEAGEWMGIPYQKKQKNIRYNHAALTVMGRAGSDVGIRMDSKGIKVAVCKKDSLHKKNTKQQLIEEVKKEIKKMTTETVKMKFDSVEIDVAQEVAVAFKKIDGEKSALEGEKVALKSEIEKRDSEIVELKKQLSDDEVLKRADALLKVKEFAGKILKDEKLDEMSIADMKTKVVASKTGLDVSKKDSAFIDASFQTLMATHKDVEGDALKEDAQKLTGKVDSIEDRAAEYHSKLSNKWKETVGKK